jgi:hypothetical protein
LQIEKSKNEKNMKDLKDNVVNMSVLKSEEEKTKGDLA